MRGAPRSLRPALSGRVACVPQGSVPPRPAQTARPARYSRVLSSQSREFQFLVSFSTRFLPRGLPRGSEGGRASGWGNPRPLRARSVGPLVAHPRPTDRCLSPRGKFELFEQQQELWREDIFEEASLLGRVMGRLGGLMVTYQARAGARVAGYSPGPTWGRGSFKGTFCSRQPLATF